MEKQEEGISILDIYNMLKKNILIVLGSLFLLIVLGFMYIFIIHTPIYESKCLVMVQYDNQEIANDISNSLRIVATVSEFLEDDLVVNYAGDKLRANGISITNEEISDGLSVKYSNSSLNITVKFKHKNEVICDDVVNAVIKSAEYMANSTLNENGDPYFLSIKNSISQVGTASKAVDVSTSKTSILVFFVIIGLVIGISASIIKELIDNRITTKESIKAITDCQIIGFIPEFFNKKDGE